MPSRRPWWRPRDNTEFLLAGGALVAATIVIGLLVAPLMAIGGPGHAPRKVLAGGGRNASSARPLDAIAGPATADGQGRTAASASGLGPSAAASAPAASAPAVSLPTAQLDGSAPPVLIVFDGSTITLTGAVPSVAAQQRLSALAEATSKTPNAKITGSLTVDPRVPESAGVRVIEMNAARFATGSSEVTPDHAVEFNRVAALMKSLPNLTVLVVGHADQRGSAAQNLTLSQARASTVVEYLTSQGISPDRMSARGVGDQSPLTQQSDAAGLALNRRTEFVFFGLLVSS